MPYATRLLESQHVTLRSMFLYARDWFRVAFAEASIRRCAAMGYRYNARRAGTRRWSRSVRRSSAPDGYRAIESKIRRQSFQSRAGARPRSAPALNRRVDADRPAL